MNVIMGEDVFSDLLDDFDEVDKPIEGLEEEKPSDYDYFEELSESKVVNPLVDQILKLKGVEGNKVKILNEDNSEEEVDFYSLPLEDQLSIINHDVEKEQESDLDDSEITFLNQLRENDLSIQDFLDNYRQSIIEELQTNVEYKSEIDDLNDEELFILDLKAKYELTDEEVMSELENNLKDKVLFDKKVSKLRTEYKQLEDQVNERSKFEKEQQEIEKFNQLVDTMTEAALKTPEFYGVSLEDDEKEEVLTFLLDTENGGESMFYRTLRNPDKLYEAAWYLKYGQEHIEALKNAYESEIVKLRQEIKKSGNEKPKVVIKQPSSKINNIHDLS